MCVFGTSPYSYDLDSDLLYGYTNYLHIAKCRYLEKGM